MYNQFFNREPIPAGIDPRTGYYPISRLEEDDDYYDPLENFEPHDRAVKSIKDIACSAKGFIHIAVDGLYQNITKNEIYMPTLAALLEDEGYSDLKLRRFDEECREAKEDYNDAIRNNFREDNLAYYRDEAKMYETVEEFLRPIREDIIEDLAWNPESLGWEEPNGMENLRDIPGLNDDFEMD